MESTMEVSKSRLFDWKQSSFLRRIAGLRIEEFIAYFFFIPCLAITMRANLFLWLEGYGLGRNIVSGIWGLVVVSVLLPLLSFFSHRSEKSGFYLVVWNGLTFLIAILIYSNLHDTIHF